jgi:hypothetical protein
MSSSDNDLLRQLYADLSSINVDSLNEEEESDDEEVLRLKEKLLQTKERNACELNSHVENYVEDESEFIKYQLESSEYLNRYFNDVPAENVLQNGENGRNNQVLPDIQLSSFVPSQKESILPSDTDALISYSLNDQVDNSQEIKDLLDSLIESIEYLALFSSDFPIASSSPQPVVASLKLPIFDETVKNLLPIPDETPRFDENQEQVDHDMMFLSSSSITVPSALDERTEADEKTRIVNSAYESHLLHESARAEQAFEEERQKNEERKMKRQQQMIKALQDNKSVSLMLFMSTIVFFSCDLFRFLFKRTGEDINFERITYDGKRNRKLMKFKRKYC